MARLRATAETIREAMQRRIRDSRAMGGDCAGCAAPTPIRLQESEPDGCNWTITTLPSLTPGCHDFVTFRQVHPRVDTPARKASAYGRASISGARPSFIAHAGSAGTSTTS